ncbi:MAG: sphingosine kinase [Planctomycetota bacterium]|nr:sphingosine kinase [Planctomycetota bacterium]
MKLLVLLNGSAGTLANSATKDEPERIRQAFEAAGQQVEVRDVEGAKLEDETRAALETDIDAIIAGGGDGTLNTIANVVAGSGKAYGVLPLGTHNHFAKDLGIPLELEPAIAALSAGEIVDLPIAEVNGRIFLNFSALGFHPEVVRHRDAQRKTLGRKKWTAMLVAFFHVFTRFPIIRVRMTTPERTMKRNTPSVIVCNNPHQMKVFGVESASVTERGLLNVYVARRSSRLGMIWLFIRAMFKSLDQAKNFESLALPQVTIDTSFGHARVSVDGEIADMRPPLRYQLSTRPLRVLVPRKEQP